MGRDFSRRPHNRAICSGDTGTIKTKKGKKKRLNAPISKFGFIGKNLVFDFGKFRGYTASEVADENIGYLKWVLKEFKLTEREKSAIQEVL